MDNYCFLWRITHLCRDSPAAAATALKADRKLTEQTQAQAGAADSKI